ncbi:MAG: type II toxin-antitoxin system VapC family toxin [Planctomycetes bacterium]|nr:type II toxin-antitoxin system VapC family toxin [Planctomycetota bacterium]
MLVPCYAPERNSALANALAQSHDERVVCALTEVEIVSALVRKVRERELSEAEARRGLALFRSHISERYFRIVPLEHKHCDGAVGHLLAAGKTLPLRSLDALHCATAVLEGLPLITADERMAKAAKSLGLSVRFLKP